MSLKEFKDSFLDATLDFLWTAWTGFGVHGTSSGKIRKVLDPEALLLFTLYFSVYDQRLMDEVIDWLTVNARWLNYRRLNTLSAGWSVVFPQLLAAGEIIQEYGKPNTWHLNPAKFKKGKQKDVKTFLLKDETPIPVMGEMDEIFNRNGFKRDKLILRGMSQGVRTDGWANLIFKLRSVFGVNSRAEIFAYLLVKDCGYPSKISRETDYSQKNIQDTLVEIAASGLLDRFPSGRSILYRLRKREEWYVHFGLDKATVPKQWIHWGWVFSELRLVWHEVRNLDDDAEPYRVFTRILTHLNQAKGKTGYPSYAFAAVYSRMYEGEGSTNALLQEIKEIYQELYVLKQQSR